MATLDAFYNPTSRTVTIGPIPGGGVPVGSVAIGSFEHPDATYPDSTVIFHGVRELLYKRKPDGTPGFWPNNITDMDRVSIVFDPAAQVIAVTGVSFTGDYDNSEMAIGSTLQLAWEISPPNATNTNVTFSSSNPAVATVSATGLVNFLAAGDTNISITSEDGEFTQSVKISAN